MQLKKQYRIINNSFVQLTLFCLAFNFSQAQKKNTFEICAKRIDSVDYFILSKKGFYSNVRKVNGQLRNTFDHNIEEYYFLDIEDVDTIADRIITRFKIEEKSILYDYTEYNVQLIPFKYNGDIFVLGYLRLQVDASKRYNCLCSEFPITLGGGSSFIRFLFKMNNDSFVFFMNN